MTDSKEEVISFALNRNDLMMFLLWSLKTVVHCADVANEASFTVKQKSAAAELASRLRETVSRLAAKSVDEPEFRGTWRGFLRGLQDPRVQSVGIELYAPHDPDFAQVDTGAGGDDPCHGHGLTLLKV